MFWRSRTSRWHTCETKLCLKDRVERAFYIYKYICRKKGAFEKTMFISI